MVQTAQLRLRDSPKRDHPDRALRFNLGLSGSSPNGHVDKVVNVFFREPGCSVQIQGDNRLSTQKAENRLFRRQETPAFF